jgi:hypothetical protein
VGYFLFPLQLLQNVFSTSHARMVDQYLINKNYTLNNDFITKLKKNLKNQKKSANLM